MSNVDIDPIADKAIAQFAEGKPSKSELDKWVSTIGLGHVDKSTIAKILIDLWDIYAPLAKKKPVCSHIDVSSSRRCGSSFVHAEYNNEEEKIYMICSKNHTTKKRMA